MKQILVILFTFISITSFSQNGFHNENYNGLGLNKDQKGNYFLQNEFGVNIKDISSLNIDPNEIIQELSNSDFADKALMVKILQMQSNPEKAINEIMHISSTQKFMTKIVLKHAYNKLKKDLSKKEFKALMKQKK